MKNALRIIAGQDAPDQSALVQQLIAIDYACFGDVDIEDIGTAEQWSNTSDACFAHIAYDNDTPVGYIDIVSLNKEGIQKLLDGTLRDGDVPRYKSTGALSPLDLYVVVIALLPEYRGRGLSKELWNKSREYFISNGYTVASLYSNVWSKEGWNFFSHFDVELKGHDKEGHRVIEVKLEDGRLPLYA